MPVVLLAIGCALHEDRTAVSGVASAGSGIAPLPATFAGMIPCADCSGQRLTLNLRPDGIFLLRRTYVGVAAGKDEHFYELGRWVASQDGMEIVLQVGTEVPHQFAIKDRGTLSMLTNEGQEIRSRLNYDLIRSERFDPIEDTFRLRGMFNYMADVASLTECLTGMRFPVAQEKDYLAVERAYLAERQTAGGPLLVTFDGRLTKRTVVEGEALKDAIVVDHFDRIWPGETCARQAMSRASLTNTYWRPVEIAGKAVTVAAGQREPHLMLMPVENRFRGFGGCNQMQGRYEVQGDGLRFVDTATTRMFCQDSMEQEGALLSALEAASSHKIVGETLELNDAGGNLLVRFESRYMK